LVDEWQPKDNNTKLSFSPEMNLFNDNINATCTSFADVKRLNEQMKMVAQKFTWLDPTKSAPVLRKFLSNFEVLQVYLGQIEVLLQGQVSQLEYYRNKVNELNKMYKDIASEIETNNKEVVRMGLRLDLQTLVGIGGTVSVDGKRYTSVNRSCAISCHRSFTTGVHHWKIRYEPTDAQGWLLIGVQSKPKANSATSYCESDTYAVNVTTITAPSNNGHYTAGSFSPKGTLRVEAF
jgi:hypothetical protein